MAIVVVGGSTKDIGKTSLVCAVVSALRDFKWTAVKITGHSYQPDASTSRAESKPCEPTIWEEKNAGWGTDTARYLAAGARRALLVTRHGPDVPINEIRAAIEDDHNIIFESNRIVGAVRPDVCLALVGEGAAEMKPSFARLLRKADALVTLDEARIESAEKSPGIPQFHLQSLSHLPPEMANWLRSQLERAP